MDSVTTGGSGILQITQLLANSFQRVRLARIGTSGTAKVNSTTYNVTLPAAAAGKLTISSYDANNYSVANYFIVRKYVANDPVFASLASNSSVTYWI